MFPGWNFICHTLTFYRVLLASRIKSNDHVVANLWEPVGHCQSIYISLPAVVSARLVTRNVQPVMRANRACLVIKGLIVGCTCYVSAVLYELTGLSIDGSVWSVLCRYRGSNCGNQRDGWCLSVSGLVSLHPGSGDRVSIGLDRSSSKMTIRIRFWWQRRGIWINIANYLLEILLLC